MKKIFLVVFIFSVILLLMHSTDAAVIRGIVYDMELEPAQDVMLKVNTIPQQTYISKDGSYSFEIPNGNYLIEAVQDLGYKKCTAAENITVTGDGEFILDLILFPDISEEQHLLDEDIDFSNILEEENQEENWFYSVLTIAIILIVIVILYTVYRSRKVKKKKTVTEEEYDPAEKVIGFIKKEGGRTTQKEIRKQFPLSEAKISLVLTELEDKGAIKKIKRGKGNVIILEKKN